MRYPIATRMMTDMEEMTKTDNEKKNPSTPWTARNVESSVCLSHPSSHSFTHPYHSISHLLCVRARPSLSYRAHSLPYNKEKGK